VPLDGLLADFDALLEEPPSERDRAAGTCRDHARLMTVLDRLAAARAACASAAHPAHAPGSEDGLGDGLGYKLRRQRVAARFPELGLYATVEPVLSGLPEDPMVGDAIDDLVDVWTELERVAWYLVRGGPEDAARYFAWSYDVHWGRHLRELQLYLHALGE
jgi:hypothetical protein